MTKGSPSGPKSSTSGSESRSDAKTLKRERAVIKRKITIALEKFESSETANAVKSSSRDSILSHLKGIERLDNQINAVFCDDDSEDLSNELLMEIDSQTAYSLDVSSRVKDFSPAPTNSNQGHISHDIKLPNLSCNIFSGEGVGNLEFFDFITQFKNVIGYRTNVSNSSKLIYLRSYLRGYASKVIQHLQNNDSNYDVAVNILESEFLNKDGLTDDLFKKLLGAKPKTDSSFLETKMYITEIRCILSDLTNYNCDLVGNDSSLKLVSHVVFSRLPFAFRQELARKLSNNYPSVTQIFDNYVDVIRTITMKTSTASKIEDIPVPSTSSESTTIPQNKCSLSNKTEMFTTVQSSSKFGNKVCRLCTNRNHSMTKCTKYPTYNDRIARCQEISLCTLCSSLNHKTDKCNANLCFGCNICKDKLHITALCPRFGEVSHSQMVNSFINSSNYSPDFILPTYIIKIHNGSTVTNVRCLVNAHISLLVSSRKLVYPAISIEV